MAEQLHVVDTDTCLGDGICADICPENCLEMVDEKAATVEDRADHCIVCGQCVAVCPTESLRMPQLSSEDFRDLGKLPFGYGEFLDFLRLRRSVRVFKDKPVERELIEKILEAASTAPMRAAFAVSADLSSARHQASRRPASDSVETRIATRPATSLGAPRPGATRRAPTR